MIQSRYNDLNFHLLRVRARVFEAFRGRIAHFARRAAVLIIANSMVGHPLESLPVSSPQNTMSSCIIILQTGGGVLTFRRIVSVSYPNFVGAQGNDSRLYTCINTLSPLPPPVPPPMHNTYSSEPTYWRDFI